MEQKVSILKTLAYHDIFDYPLTFEEISNYLISSRTKILQLQKQLNLLIRKGEIEDSKGYYFLKNKRSTVAVRISRQKNSQVKLRKAQFFASILKIVPSIQMVAISGALAMENSLKNDDIDLVIIAKANTLWTTRLIANVLLFPLKRKPGSKKTDNRACLNLFLDESDLKIKSQNIYQAHEICQMKPLWARNKTYSRFIHQNRWVFKYLPNWEPTLTVIPAKAGIRSSRGVPKKALVVSLPAKALSPLEGASAGRFALVAEIFAKKFQLLYMRKKISTERIGETQLFFHPANTQDRVLKEYEKSLKKLGLLR